MRGERAALSWPQCLRMKTAHIASSPALPQGVSPAAPGAAPAAPGSPRLLDRLRGALRVRQYAMATERSDVDWVRRYILFHGKRHPAEMGAAEVTAFLTDLAVQRQVAPNTQSQAKAALLFLYRELLGVQLPWLDEVVQAKAAHHLPVVLTAGEVRAAQPGGCGQGRWGGRSRSQARATRSTPMSSKRRPAICRPMGRPAAV